MYPIEYATISAPTPEMTSISKTARGSTRIESPTSRSPIVSHVHAVETTCRSSVSRERSSTNVTTAPPNETATESVARYPARRREIRVSASTSRTTAASGATRQTQAAAIMSAAQSREPVDVEDEPAPGHRHDQPEAHDDLRGGYRHDRQREDLPVAVPLKARERDQGEVAAVEHDLDREQHDQRVAPDEHAERADREQRAGYREVPGDVRAVHDLLAGLLQTRWGSLPVPPDPLHRSAFADRLLRGRPRVVPEHDAADGGSEHDDRGDLEREQVLRQKEAPERGRAAEGAVDLRLVLEPVARGEADDHDDLEQQGGCGGDRAQRLPARAARPPGRLGLVGEVGDHEQEHDHDRAGVDEEMPGGQELGREQQVEDGERAQIPDQRERRVEGVREGDDGDTGSQARERGDEPDDPDQDVADVDHRRRLRVALVVGDGRVVELGIRDRNLLDRRRQEHVLRVDLVVAVVLGELVLVAERDRVERARELAIAAEDAAADVDLVDPRVPLAGRDAVVGRVLGGDDADAVRRAGRGAERAADALLEPVLVSPEPMAPAPAWVHGALVLGVLLRDRLLEELLEGDREALERAEGGVRVGHQISTTKKAVTTALTVATGSSTFQPNRISWS